MTIFIYMLLIVGTFAALRIICGLIFSNIQQLLNISAEKSVNYQPLLSVIIPAYNEEKTIYQCVMSVINQTYHR